MCTLTEYMSLHVPNSDDPALLEGLENEPKRLAGWNLLVYRCKQQPLVPIGITPPNPSLTDEVPQQHV